MIRPDRGRGLVFRYLLALVALALFLFPIYWLFMISFKTPDEIFAHPPAWWPQSIQFANYAVLFKDGDVVTIWNSFVIAGGSSVIAMVFGTMCAYSIARFRTGGNLFADWMLSNRMIPPIEALAKRLSEPILWLISWGFFWRDRRFLQWYHEVV